MKKSPAPNEAGAAAYEGEDTVPEENATVYEISNIRFSSDGRFVTAGAAKGSDGTVNLWEIDWIHE